MPTVRKKKDQSTSFSWFGPNVNFSDRLVKIQRLYFLQLQLYQELRNRQNLSPENLENHVGQKGCSDLFSSARGAMARAQRVPEVRSSIAVYAGSEAREGIDENGSGVSAGRVGRIAAAVTRRKASAGDSPLAMAVS